MALTALVAVCATCAEENPKDESMTDAPTQHTNRLIDETSPYLLQHAHNPVDWYPWGEEAFARARKENKPIFLSIGYSSCHWCHVMERESFENEETAAYLNEHFISIKVDREERPDVDEVYMNAVMMMTGRGGWPMSVFLTPDRKPFYGGTYFPPESKYGMPGFGDLLASITDLYTNQPDKIANSVDRLHTAMTERADQVAGQTADGKLPNGAEVIAAAATDLGYRVDERWGGFGRAPKFPNSPAISVLLRHYARTGNARSLEVAEKTLEMMARGGMYDQVGGGFHRYSVDAIWLVPHFEKMLYDNAQLADVYLDAWRATGKDFYRRVAVETLDYILDDMTSPGGGFYSARDADSEGEEGKFYVWSKEEIGKVLGEEDAEVFNQVYDVSDEGNFEGHNILFLPKPIDEVASKLETSTDDLLARLERTKQKLLKIRSKRVPPLRDDKILTDWNALMVSAFANGAQTLGEERFVEAARRAGRFLLDELRDDKGRLFHVTGGSEGKGEARVPGFLPDYSYTIDALIDLYEMDFDPDWLAAATELAGVMIDEFSDTEGGGFYMTADPAKTKDTGDDLILRPKRWFDASVPSGASIAALALLRLSKLSEDGDKWRDAAESTLTAAAASLENAPTGTLAMAIAAGFAGGPSKEVVIIGPRKESAKMLAAVRERYRPNVVVAFHDPADGQDAVAGLPLFEGREAIDGKPTAYVCENFTCKLPVQTVYQLQAQLGD